MQNVRMSAICSRCHWQPQGLHWKPIRDPLKLTSPAQHASRSRMRASQTCRLRLLVLPAGLARMRHRENRRDREFMLGNSVTKLPARCMLGMRGEFEGLANSLAMLPL